MAKRGRKPKERKGYFYENEEQAVIDYISTEDKNIKNEIFNKYLFPAFVKMIESIIRRYNLYCTDEEFQQTFNDTLSYLMSKISHYKPNPFYVMFKVICIMHFNLPFYFFFWLFKFCDFLYGFFI